MRVMKHPGAMVVAVTLTTGVLHGLGCQPCQSDEVYKDGRCRQTCNADHDCAAGDHCDNGVCLEGASPVPVNPDAGVVVTSSSVALSATSGIQSSTTSMGTSSLNSSSHQAGWSSTSVGGSTSAITSSSHSGVSSSHSSGPAEVDLAVTLLDGVDFVEPGGRLHYRLHVSNAGPQTATGVTVTDVFSAEFTQVQWSTSATGGAAGHQSQGAGAIQETGITLPPGANILYAITADLAAGLAADTRLSNTATVSTAGNVVERNPINNSATEQVTVKVLEFSIADVAVVEGNSGMVDAVFRVSLQFPPSVEVGVDCGSVDDSAGAAAGDYVPNGERLAFQPGTTERSFTVEVKGDGMVEPDETFLVVLTHPSPGVTVADQIGTCTIRNDDLPRATIADLFVDEVYGTTTEALFTVSLDQLPAAAVDIGYTTVAGTATEGADYQPALGTLQFTETGPRSRTVSVLVNGDAELEVLAEQFMLMLTANPTQVILDRNQATCRIMDAGAVVQFASDHFTVEERLGAGVIVLERPMMSMGTISVTVDFIDETAEGNQQPLAPGSDYESTPQVVYIPGSVTQKEVSFVLLNDTVRESQETFQVRLSQPMSASLGARHTATVTIVDND